MNKVTLKDIVSTMNSAPSGGFVGITNYESESGEVSSVTGLLGCSYADTVALKIKGLTEAIAGDDFEDITVKGQGYADMKDGKVIGYGRKSNARTLINFCKVYTKEQVLTFAKEILFAWENPKARTSNKVQLTDKEDGLSLNTETSNFNFTLLVQQQTYKEALSDQAKAGKEVKVKATQPDTVLKDTIRKRFEKKIKSFTISEGKFASMTVGGQKFLSEQITF